MKLPITEQHFLPFFLLSLPLSLLLSFLFLPLEVQAPSLLISVVPEQTSTFKDNLDPYNTYTISDP